MHCWEKIPSCIAITIILLHKTQNLNHIIYYCHINILQDPKWLSQVHGGIGTAENATALRLLYYPPLPEDSNIKPGQVRCGEHSDYGSITLLFQDDVGGLEVRDILKTIV